jgi:two-component sensor histidine kinase
MMKTRNGCDDSSPPTERSWEAALNENRLRLQLALDAASMGTFIWYVQEDRSEPDAQMLALCGLPPDAELTLKNALETILHPDDRERCADAVARATDPKGDGRLKEDFRICLPSGSERWLAIKGQVYFEGHSPLPVRMAGAAIDITERKAGEARQAFLLKLSDALRPLADPIAVQDEALRLVAEYVGACRAGYAEDQGDSRSIVVTRNFVTGVPGIEGRHSSDDYGSALLKEFRAGRTVVRPDIANDPTLSDAERAAHTALQIGATLNIPLLKSSRLAAMLFLHYREAHTFSPAELGLLADVAERTWEAVERARAGQAEHAAQERQKLLLAELQHRVRNILATIRSIVQRSARTSDTVEDLSMHLEGRIDSLARTQVVLSRNPGKDVDLEDLLRDELLAQSADEDQIEIKGPAVRLPPKAAEVLTLALHELATNALKYGALHDGAGRVAIVWRVDSRGGERWLRLSWTETCVRVLGTAPRREGFGTELITKRVPYELSGKGVFEFQPGGMCSTIEFPLRPSESILETGRQL